MDTMMMKQVAWIGDDYLQGAIRGVALSFHGLGYMQEKTCPDTVELEWAKAGWLIVFPYYGPWSWMNREARAFVDELVESVYARYGLGSGIPLASTGGSMGGLSALLYTRYAKKPVSTCLALFPVCDLEYHFGERPDLPRSIHGALRGYSGDFNALLAEHSPLAQVRQMPDIPYLFIHGDMDEAVNKAAHSDRMVAAMKSRDMDVEYMEVPGMRHGDCIPVGVYIRMIRFLAEFSIR
jgi:dipeptidyl aminopeptidase/acylaminoacyl peptidase